MREFASPQVHDVKSQGNLMHLSTLSNPSSGLARHSFRELQRGLGNEAFGRFVQAKLKISEPNDMHEQEADHIADQVMRMPDIAAAGNSIGVSSPTPLLQRACSQCKEDEEEKTLQRKASGGPLASASGKGGESSAMRNDAVPEGGGEPLASSVRNF